MHTVGSRAEVWHGNAEHTSGGLTKKDLLQNKWGRIVSAKKEKRLEKAGFFTKQGKFGAVKRATKKMRKSRKAKKMKGGEGEMVAPEPVAEPVAEPVVEPVAEPVVA